MTVYVTVARDRRADLNGRRLRSTRNRLWRFRNPHPAWAATVKARNAVRTGNDGGPTMRETQVRLSENDDVTNHYGDFDEFDCSAIAFIRSASRASSASIL